MTLTARMAWDDLMPKRLVLISPLLLTLFLLSLFSDN
jgi:hypothetical protein